MIKTKRTTRGFTVLFAALISALLLAVGLAIFDIIFKEVSFATVVRDSNYAIYAADTGAECAEYWDFKYKGTGNYGDGTTPHSAFATSTASNEPTSGLFCSGQDIMTANSGVVNAFLGAGTSPQTGPNSATTTFAIYLDPVHQNPPYCSIVQVSKSVDPTTGDVSTLIIARGYNTCDTGNPNRIERTYLITY